MPLREFPDSFGRIWQAWDTYPQGACIQSATIYYIQTRSSHYRTRAIVDLVHGQRRSPH